MRLRKSIITILCCIVASCTSKSTGDVISADKMKDILTDMHYADTYSSMLNDTLHMSGAKNMDSLAVFYKSILEHHKVSVEEFNESIKWYKLNPEKLDSVYAAMIPMISKMEATYPNK